MPVASSSRQRRRRQASSDIEEDATPPMTRHESSGALRRRASGNVTRVAQQASEGEGQSMEDIVKNFKDQPLDRAQIQKLSGIAEDWGMMRRQVHANYFTLVKDVGASLAEFADADKGEKALMEIDNVMRQLLDTENELKTHEDVLKGMVQQLTRAEQPPLMQRYEEGIHQGSAQYKEKTSRQKYAKSEEYLKFKQAIFEVQNPETAMPPLTDFIPREDGDDSEDEDDVQVGGVTQDYRCPITLTILQDPVTSTVCGHSFSSAAIKEYFGNKPSVGCPTTGCRKMITLASLERNKELAKQARDAARRERARNDSDDESDDDDVIE